MLTHDNIPASNFRMASTPGLPWRGANSCGNENKDETAFQMHAADDDQPRGVIALVKHVAPAGTINKMGTLKEFSFKS